MIESNVKSLVNDLATALVSAAPETSPTARANCQALTPQITASIMGSAAHVLDQLDALIVDTFSIPANIVLPEHQLLVKYPSTADEEKGLQTELDELMKTYKQVGS